MAASLLLGLGAWLLPASAQVPLKAAQASPLLQHQAVIAKPLPAVIATVPDATLKRRVPPLVGLRCDEALQWARRLDLKLDCQPGSRYGQVAVGLINQQQPAANAALPADRTLRVQTEPAPPPAEATTVRVPDVVGYNVIEAMARLRDAQFLPRPEAGDADEFHFVTASKPAAGSTARRGQLVALKAEPRYRVPVLTRLSCAQALERARASGFPSLRCEEADAGRTTAAGRVFDQSPRADEVLGAPREILVLVARATAPVPARVEVPAVEGLSLGDAVARVQRSGLAASTRGPSQAPGLRVQHQEPPAGTRVEKGSVVTMEAAIVVPDLSGRTCNEARLLARDAGIDELGCVRQVPPDESAAPGRVFYQQPAAGTAWSASQPLEVQIAALAVPDVEGLGLPEALAQLRGLGLQPRADDERAAEERVVETQQPVANTVVERGAAVRLVTRRWIVVPALQGMTCAAARDRLPAGPTFDCVAERRWWAWGEPRIDRQEPAPAARVPEGTTLHAGARAEPPWLAGTAGLAVLALSVFGLARFAAPAGAGAALHLEARPDLHPAVALRFDDATDTRRPGLTVRAQAGPGTSFLRELRDPP